MSIIYHDNNGASRYENGQLADNWDAAADYGDEYARVFFRIECPTYYSAGYCGFQTAEQRGAFYAEAAEILDRCGYHVAQMTDAIHSSGASLYIHPQEITGEVLKNDVRHIAEALNSAEVFSVRWVDIYETVYNMTDEAYRKYLDDHEAQTRELILNRSKTNRRDLFKSYTDIASSAAAQIRLPRLNSEDGKHVPCSGKTYLYTCELISTMLREGYLVEATSRNGMRLIRTINRAEQKERGLNVA